MFEAVELGQKIDKKTFSEQEPGIHVSLLEAQRELLGRRVPLIVIVSGAEGAGKGALVHRLNGWFDPRGTKVHAFWDETQEEQERPRYWRFWRALPGAGSIAIMFGSWYTQPIIDRVSGTTSDEAYERELHRIESFERLLTDDGTLLVKFWFHLSKKEQKKRLREEIEEGRTPSPYLKTFSEQYDAFIRRSERAIRITDTGFAPWHLVESTNSRYRDLTVGRILLDTIRSRLNRADAASPEPDAGKWTADSPATVLDRVDLTASIDPKKYDAALEKGQKALSNLAWRARRKRHSVVAVCEGWDASGKGGAIRRVTQAIDARLYETVSIAAPTDEERAHHYLWRFWKHVPRPGTIAIYDRSWYGRVLVERVEGLARIGEWKRAYQEINDFEEQLVESGVTLVKFWMHISRDEQLRRFEERERIEWKRHKITEDDWRNRERWDDYRAAVNEMIARTSTVKAPWTIVAGNDKKYARVQVVDTLRDSLARALGEP